MDSIDTTKIASSATAGVQSAGSNAEYTLIAPNYSRAGYGFAGWSTDFDATNSSIIYGPNETITTGNLGTNGMILYPVWVASTGMLQNWNGCNSLTTADPPNVWDVTGRSTLASMTALTDARDGNVYTVARLADGKCWMTENLRINAEATRGDTNRALAQGYGSYSGSGTNYGNFIGLADSENANFNSNDPSSANNATNSLYSSDGSTAINIGSSDGPGYRIPRYNSNNTNRSLTPNYNANDNTDYYQWYGYGNYYNWTSAVANTNYFDASNISVTTTSLCPAGWRLPQGGDKTRIESDNDNDFWTLVVTNLNGGTKPANYSSSTYPHYTGDTEGVSVAKLVRTFPSNFVLSGYWNGTRTWTRNSTGIYQSSTVNEYRYAHDFIIRSSYVGPAARDLKWGGFAVRCIK
ncbi:hypothetical protein IKG33_01155 [Candidatus Saccharibacteria bacterium]|nr:hypothetical protein [Candidatus Saccharibacteria bacterium]